MGFGIAHTTSVFSHVLGMVLFAILAYYEK